MLWRQWPNYHRSLCFLIQDSKDINWYGGRGWRKRWSDSPSVASFEAREAGEAERTGATEAGRLVGRLAGRLAGMLEGRLEGGVALTMGVTTAGEPGPRSMRLSSVASLRT